MSQKIINKIVLVTIICIAAALRFYNYWNIPFTHDEFSAIFRTEFNSFQDLIDFGVKGDGHPAGIQVFLYYWIKLFGVKEWIIKLPFTIMGIGVVYLGYLVGKQWFSRQTGHVFAAFLAVSQYMISYSIIARPYMSGLFFTLSMFYFWSKIIFSKGRVKNKTLLFFAFFATLAAYNHHFSMLFAFIVGIMGTFFVSRKNLYPYIFAGVLIFLLYLPHLNILLTQLEIGGIGGWLSKPKPAFILNYFYYIFHYSLLYIIIVATIILYSVFLQRSVIQFSKKNFILLSLFIFPFLIGYFYSVYINSVLQFSVLIFSFPFLFLCLFGYQKNAKYSIVIFSVVIILAIGISTLAYNRQHYYILYNSIYKQALLDAQNVNEHYDEVSFLLNSHTQITDYYLSKNTFDYKYIRLDTIKSLPEIICVLKNNSTNKYLYYACNASSNPYILGFIVDDYKGCVVKRNYFKGNTYLFSLNPVNPIVDTIWNYNEEANISKRIKSNSQYGPSKTVDLNNIKYDKNDFLDISIDLVLKDSIRDIKLVANLTAGNKPVWSNDTYYDKFYNISDSLTSFTLHNILKLSDINLDFENLMLKTYLYNKSKGEYFIDNFTIRLIKGNPIIYGRQGNF